MCGRYTREFTWRQVHDFLDLKFPSIDEMEPSFNAAPAQMQPVCQVGEGGERKLAPMLWGFVPSWAQAGKGGLAPINARGETAATSQMFKDAMVKRRCLVPASAFYEWKKVGDAKQPYAIRVKDSPIFCFAGIWEPGHGEAPPTFAILTTHPNPLMAQIHDRMPVMLDHERHAEWLAGRLGGDDLLAPFPEERMEAYTVSTRVGNPQNNDPSLVRRAEPEGLFG